MLSLPKNFFLSKSLRTVSILALSAILLESPFMSSTQAMDGNSNPDSSDTLSKTRKSKGKKRKNTNPERSAPKRQKTTLVVVKKEPLETRPIHTKEYITEKFASLPINPRNGTKICLKCSISFYNWVRTQSENPQQILNITTPKKYNIQSHPNNQDYMMLCDAAQISLLPSGMLELALTENGNT